MCEPGAPDATIAVPDATCFFPVNRHWYTLHAYRARQNSFAGMKPVCCVRTPITQITPLFTAATTHPCHLRRPIIIVEMIVSTHDK
jgi:hypothetical protein